MGDCARHQCVVISVQQELPPHRVRFHSSSALCARVPVCGGAQPSARMKGLSGSVEDGTFVIAATARKMPLSLML